MHKSTENILCSFFLYIRCKYLDMRKLLLLCLFCSSSICFGAPLKPIAAMVQRFHEMKHAFPEYALFEKTSSDLKKYEGILPEYTAAKLSLQGLAAIAAEKPQTIRIRFPFNNEWIAVDLYQTNITTADYKIQTDKGYYSDYQKGIFYRGIIVGDNASLVAFSFFKNQVVGVVSGAAYGDINIGKLVLANNTDQYIIYSTQKLLVDVSLKCHTRNQENPATSFSTPSANSPQSTDKCVRMYYELPYHSYVNHGSDMTQSIDWAMAVHNNVSAAFANDGISNTPLSEIFVWTTPDNYEVDLFYGHTLYSFRKRRYAFNGDLANLLKSDSTGGYATDTNALCKGEHGTENPQGPYEETGDLSQINDFPIFSPTVKSVAHECGHLLGSSHTHKCVWNGNWTQIDDCGTNSVEGVGCYDPEHRIIPEVGMGTIMSYCTNALSAGFGPQPSALIINKIESGTCLGTNCSENCSPSIAKLLVTEVGQTSAKLTIVEENPNVTSWQFRIPPNNFITITSNPYVITGLPPKGYIQFEVQQVCNNPIAGDYLYGGTIYTSGVYCSEGFADRDGFNAFEHYSYQTSLYPENATDKVSLQFTHVTMPSEAEGVVVHDGPNIDSPIIGTFMGSIQNPPALTSTHPTGALCVQCFTVESDREEDSFYANVTCVSEPLAAAGFVKSSFSYGPNPVVDNFYFEADAVVKSVKITDVLGRTISIQSVGNKSGRIAMDAYAAGQYLTIVYFENRQEVIRLLKK